MRIGAAIIILYLKLNLRFSLHVSELQSQPPCGVTVDQVTLSRPQIVLARWRPTVSNIDPMLDEYMCLQGTGFNLFIGVEDRETRV